MTRASRDTRGAVSDFPRLQPRALFASRSRDGMFREFYGKDAGLFYFGRGALWYAMRSLRLAPSDNVLVPAYHCGVEIEAVSMAGAQLRYYDVTEECTVDLDDLRKRIDSGTRALLLVHYFGFPQPVEEIRDICRAANVVLIEDCCHALFSSHRGAPLGTFGDAAIFSQRKTLPLPDGGALIFNAPERGKGLTPDRPGEVVAVKKALGMLFRSTFNSGPHQELPYPLELINKLITARAGARYSTGMQIDMARCNLAMSATSKWLMDRTPVAHVVERRRQNYRHLVRMVQETRLVTVVHRELPEGVCPLFFPVRVKQGLRESIQHRLDREGIATFIFGDVPHPTLPKGEFGRAERLSQEILCLPVHQDLDLEDMKAVAEALSEAVREADHADH
jgi:perosamine synthetase